MNVIIDTPVIGPPSHDLLASAYKPPLPEHWEQGIVFPSEDITGLPASGEVVLCGATTKSDPLTCGTNVEYTPFLIEVGVERPVLYSSSQREDIARRAMERGQRSIIETRMATGSIVGNQYLGDANSTIASAGTFTPEAAIGVIQTQFATAGGQGTIYVSPLVAEALDEHLTEVDGKLYTQARHDLVIVGNFGSVGPGDAAAAAGTSWVMGHLGVPSLLLGEIMVFEAIDWKTNQPTLRAERVAAVVWNPFQWGVLASVDDGTP